MNISYLQCTLCGEKYASDQVRYVCPKHGNEGLLEVVCDCEKISRLESPSAVSNSHDFSMWRYWELLPLENRGVVPPLRVGWTPLYRASRLGGELGLSNLYLKDDGLNPTGSSKDRASAVVVAKAMELNAGVTTTATSGNAGAALAGLAASVGMPTVIFLPDTAPRAKIAQLLIFGANVFLVKGTYDDAYELCLASSREFDWYCRNTAYNPYTTEGKKTVALEICEQMALIDSAHPRKWVVPDRIFVSVGDGNILGGTWKGLRDSLALGWIDKMPKLMGVQAEGAAACYNAWRACADKITPVAAHTIADSINVGLPRDGMRAVRAIRDTNGEFVKVSDQDMLDAIRQLGCCTGVFAEPAAAAGYAGLVRSVRNGDVQSDEKVVVIITGNGLKDVPSAMKAAGVAKIIKPKIEEVAQFAKNITRRASAHY